MMTENDEVKEPKAAPGVSIVDIDVPLLSLFKLSFKLAIAAIPATLIYWLIAAQLAQWWAIAAAR